jgi:hypothetical protein
MTTPIPTTRAAVVLAGCFCLLLSLTAHPSPAATGAAEISVSAGRANDLYRVLSHSRIRVRRYDTPAAALAGAKPGSALLILAGGYPKDRTQVPQDLLTRAREKALRTFIEYPASLPGVTLGSPKAAEWERLVVSTDAFGTALPRLRILSLPEARILPVSPAPADAWLLAGRVAGFDTAPYGIPQGSMPVLWPAEDGVMVATTCLSRMVEGRYAPTREWQELWGRILAWLRPTQPPLRVGWRPQVRPAYGPAERLSASVERDTLRRAVRWTHRSGLLVPDQQVAKLHTLLRKGVETQSIPHPLWNGDGSNGILEGYSSGIQHDGSQLQRLPLRADCQAESAMMLAIGWHSTRERRSRTVANNLMRFLYERSNLHGGVRGDPKHPAFGLIGWGTIAPAWEVATYGDDEARVLLASAAASVWLNNRSWDRSMVRALVANLRTTGGKGFRGDRVDIPALEQRGWKAYREADTVNLSPSFEAYLWACYLWAYEVTGERDFLDRTYAGIRTMMAAYPSGWRWGDNLDRCRMILPLAWLVRIQDTPQHRRWLSVVVEDMLKRQQPSGGLAEQVNEAGGGGHFRVAPTNEAYGTGETPLIQRNGDPVSDQLYTSGFALIGLREANAAMGNRWKEAEDRLALYLCRIQIRASKHPYLDGMWFRGFDYGRWDYFASSGDIGWGPWCVESGWAPAWGLATLALRRTNGSLWELVRQVPLKGNLPSVRAEMALNAGGPASR